MWLWIVCFLLAVIILAIIEETLQYTFYKYLSDSGVEDHRFKYYVNRFYRYLKEKLKKGNQP